MGNKRFYGWVNVVFSALMIFSVLGFNATMPLYVKPIADALGVDRSAVSLVPTIIGLSLLITSLSYGALSSLLGIKRLLVLGVALVPAAMAVMAAATDLRVFYLCGVFIGIGFTLTTTIPLSAILSNWFIERRGLVLGLVFAASGIGGMVFNPLVGHMIENLGWSMSMWVQAGVIVVIGIPASILIVEHPKSKQQVALGAEDAPAGGHGHGEIGVSIGEAVRSLSFYMTFIGVMLISFSVQLIMFSVPNYLSDTNFDPAVAANVMAGVFAVNAVAKIGLGRLNDSRGIWAVLTSIYVTFTLAVLGIIGVNSSAILYAFPLFFGIALAVMTVPLPLFIQYVFGGKAYAAIMGLQMSALAIGGAMGAPFGNVINERMGSYVPSFWLVIVLALLSFAAFGVAGSVRPVKSPKLSSAVE